MATARLYGLGGLFCLGIILMFTLLHAGQTSADSATLIGMVNNGDIYVKSGSTTAPWTTRLTTSEDATQLQMYGDRVAFVDGSNNLWLKQGLTSQWYEEVSNVQSYALTENGLLVLQNGGDVSYKSGASPTAQWDANLIANDATKVYLTSEQLVIIDTSGNLIGKSLTPKIYSPYGWGPDSGWVLVTQNASFAALNDNALVYVDTQGNAYVKTGSIEDTWSSGTVNSQGPIISSNVSQVELSGTMYCWVSSGSMWCKPYNLVNTADGNVTIGDGFTSIPMFVWGYTTNSVGLAPGEIVVDGNDGDGNTYLYGMDYSKINYNSSGYSFTTAGWNTLSTTGTEITTNQE